MYVVLKIMIMKLTKNKTKTKRNLASTILESQEETILTKEFNTPNANKRQDISKTSDYWQL